MGKTKEISWLAQKGLGSFQQIGSQFDVGTTWAYIAEAYYIKGNRQKYENAKSTSKSILST
jgi:hypothetical protein